MSDFRQRHRITRVWYRRLITLVLLLAVFGLAQGVWGVFRKERETHANRERAETQLATLEARERELRAEIAYLKTGRGVEEELRQQFEVGRVGESMLLIVERPAPEPTEQEEQKPWWRRLWPWGN